MDYEIRESAEKKQYKDRTLSEHLSMSRAERPDEWEMDFYIKKAKELEIRLSTLTNKGNMPCTCKPVPMSKCLQRQLYVDDNCPQHGAHLS